MLFMPSYFKHTPNRFNYDWNTVMRSQGYTRKGHMQIHSFNAESEKKEVPTCTYTVIINMHNIYKECQKMQQNSVLQSG